jgi:N-carbamoyl-L-amino-acid hydrolase
MIGVVTGVQGIRWFEVTVTGQDAHTGATPMRLRKNALLGAARLIEAVDAIALAHAPDAVGTVGLIENRPNSRNVVPGEVFFCVDFRHPEDGVLDRMEAEFRAALPPVLEPLKLTFEETRIWNSPAVTFAPELIECVEAGARKSGYASRKMVSGAGHDAAYIARVAPTTMIFVPCAGGLSHNELESTSFDECGAGAQVLLEAVLEYDKKCAG